MQGINKAKHAHLMDALIGLERLVSRQCADEKFLLEIAEHRDRLVTLIREYDHMLTELANLITDYEVLYSEVKMQFLAKKLKEMKREMAVNKPSFVMLKESISLAYGT